LPDISSAGEGLDLQFARSGDRLYARRRLHNVHLEQAAAALNAGDLDVCQKNLAGFLKKHPKNPDALNLMAELAMRAGEDRKAQDLLEQCLALSSDFDGARFNYAGILRRLNKLDEAIAQLDRLLQKDPKNLVCRNMKALLLATQGREEEAVECYRQLVKDFPDSAELWVHYGHALRIKGLGQECIAAYRKAIEILPSFGIAYSSLAHLKTYRFDEHEVERMQAALANPTVRSEQRIEIHFSLGKAYADLKIYEKSFENYSRANALRRVSIEYDPDAVSERFSEFKTFFSREFFEERAGSGCTDIGPIFVLGMHRSGSTLIEQILACHPAIEGAGELPEIPVLAARLESEAGPNYGTSYPDMLKKLDRADFQAMGEQYLRDTRARRKLGRQFFVDKCPYNLWNVGLIHLILPNAKIIDARRHPLGCCFSNFTMNFASGIPYFFRQTELARYYSDYVGMMAHFDQVLPGKVHRVTYEKLVDDLETEVRRMLDFLGLPFEEGCLLFHQNDRPVSTLSSEQVRRPIYRQGVDEWRNYEQWLGPMKSVLAPLLEPRSSAPPHNSVT